MPMARELARRRGEIELTYCVVNTSQRELLLRGPGRDRRASATRCRSRPRCSCSTTARATARPRLARAHPTVDEPIALARRRGKGANDSSCCAARAGRYALLLNEDSELRPGATLALWQALQERPAGRLRRRARCARPDGRRPALRLALPLARDARSRARCSCTAGWSCRAAAAHAARSTGASPRRCSCAARRPPQVDYLDPDFFVYSDEVDFARRLRDAGWRSLYVPRRRGGPPRAALDATSVPERRIVELARNRDLYMRKHHSAAAARAVRWLTAWAYALRALAALVLPGRPRALLAPRHGDAAPERGEGLREAAERLQPLAAEELEAPLPAVRGYASRSGSSAYASTSPCPAAEVGHPPAGVGEQRAGAGQLVRVRRSGSAAAAPGRAPATPARERARRGRVGRQQQLAGDGDAAEDRGQLRQPPPLEADA